MSGNSGNQILEERADMKIKAGESYINGWGTEVPIVKAPDKDCRWFLSDLGHGYHETGEMVGISTMPHFNLLRPAHEIEDAAVAVDDVR
jgi:hypothetical protein